MPHVFDTDDTRTAFHGATIICHIVFVSHRRNHNRSFHFDCSRGGENATATAVEELVVFHERDRVDGGIKSTGTTVQQVFCGTEVGEEGRFVFRPKLWWEGRAVNGACAAMKDKGRLESWFERHLNIVYLFIRQTQRIRRMEE
jgi:hypothetical protein